MLRVILFSILISSCSQKLNLKIIGENTYPFDRLNQNIITIFGSDCFKLKLNSFPKEHETLISMNGSFSVYIKDDMNIIGLYNGSGIHLNSSVIKTESSAIAITVHELGHAAGFDHPKEINDEYHNSFINQAAISAANCSREMGLLNE